MLYTTLASPPAVKLKSWINGHDLPEIPICPILPSGIVPVTAVGVLASLSTFCCLRPAAPDVHTPSVPCTSTSAAADALKYTPSESENVPD
jgi:hypothetical protein